MRISTSKNNGTQYDSGAIKASDNFATNVGYVTMASGAALAMGVGAAVAPAPTIGLLTLGAGTVVVANFKEVKAHFTSDSKKTVTEEAPAV